MNIRVSICLNCFLIETLNLNCRDPQPYSEHSLLPYFKFVKKNYAFDTFKNLLLLIDYQNPQLRKT